VSKPKKQPNTKQALAAWLEKNLSTKRSAPANVNGNRLGPDGQPVPSYPPSVKRGRASR